MKSKLYLVFVSCILAIVMLFASCEIDLGIDGYEEKTSDKLVNDNTDDVTDGERDPSCAHANVEWITAVEPTCSGKGERRKTCLDCNKVTKAEPIDALPHTEGEWVLVSKGDYGVAEIRSTNCTVCGEELFQHVEELRYSQGLEYTDAGDGACIVSGIGECTDKELIIPAVNPDGKQVVEIGESAFAGEVNVESVYMGGSIGKIGAKAFAGCTSLKSVFLRSAASTIEEGVFAGCNSLEQISIELGNESFIINDGFLLDSAEKTVLAYFGGKGNPSVPDGVEAIGDGVFKGLDVTSIILPKSVRSIGDEAFSDCNALVTINYSGTPSEWNAIVKGNSNYDLLEAAVNCAGGEVIENVRWFGRSTLSGNALYVYDELVKAVMADDPAAKIELASDMSVTKDEYHLAQKIFFSDHPECFWWNGKAIYYENQDGYVISIEPEYSYLGAELSRMKSELSAVVEEILSGMPDGSIFEKALYLHDAVADRVTYTFTERDQDPYGALVEGRAVCNGYATSYQMLLQEAGIRAWTVNGVAGGEAHAWNIVWMNDSACVYTDVTWDDQGDRVYHYYFNMSLDEIDDDHLADATFKLPTCEHYSWGCTDVDPDCNLLDDDSSPAQLAEFFGEILAGERVAQFFYLGKDFNAWFEKNAPAMYSLIDCDGFSLSSHGNEYVLIARGAK